MSVFRTNGIQIAGIATAVPQKTKKSADIFEKAGDKHIDKYIKKVGIKEFHVVEENQTASDLGYCATKELLDRLNFDTDKLGFIVFATSDPDYKRPGTAFVLHNRLKLREECACIDAGLGCAGFMNNFQVASSMLENSDSKYALLIVAATTSKYVRENDQSVMAMFGDAASAILLQKVQSNDQRITVLCADGSQFKSIILPAGEARDPKASEELFVTKDGIEKSLFDIHMNGMAVFLFSLTQVTATIKKYLKLVDKTCDDYDVICLHQANLFIIKEIAKELGCDDSKFLVSIDRYGNTSGVSIPLTLSDTYGNENGKKRILICGFGVGFSWGVSEIEIDVQNVLPIIQTDEWYKEGRIRIGEL